MVCKSVLEEALKGLSTDGMLIFVIAITGLGV
jgi:hypothetical protein